MFLFPVPELQFLPERGMGESLEHQLPAGAHARVPASIVEALQRNHFTASALNANARHPVAFALVDHLGMGVMVDGGVGA